MNGEFLRKIEAAWQKRANRIPNDTTCFRVVDGEGDACPRFWLEWLDGRLLAQTTGKTSVSAEDAEAIAGLLHADSVYHKRLDQNVRASPHWLFGTPVERPFTVLENGIKFELDFSSGYSQGLFLDQRNNRLRVRERAAAGTGANADGRRVLNCFAYTCAFSVAAALEGAVTTSVDLSASSLDWGRRNFALNGLDPARHFFTKGDVFDWLGAFAKKGHRWQGIVLDPPTFSRGIKKKVFRVESDYAELVRLTLRVLDSKGWLLCCANTRGISGTALEDQIRTGVAEAGRRIAQWENAPMPFDFTGEPYLKSFWLVVD